MIVPMTWNISCWQLELMRSALKPCTDQTHRHLSLIAPLVHTECFLVSFDAVWIHVKLHLVLPQAGTERLRRISVAFWWITTSGDGEGRIHTERGFLALLNTLMGTLTRGALLPHSQWRNTTSPHYIILVEATRVNLHSDVLDMTDIQ